MGTSESIHFKMPHCWKSHGTAQMFISISPWPVWTNQHAHKFELSLKGPITTAADDKFCDIFPNL